VADGAEPEHADRISGDGATPRGDELDATMRASGENQRAVVDALGSVAREIDQIDHGSSNLRRWALRFDDFALPRRHAHAEHALDLEGELAPRLLLPGAKASDLPALGRQSEKRGGRLVRDLPRLDRGRDFDRPECHAHTVKVCAFDRLCQANILSMGYAPVQVL
jgi:hypothetical protein